MARSELRTHPKFRRLVRQLKLPVPYVMGLLECMWQCSYQTGTSLLGDGSDVELAAEWPGKPGILFAALLEQRFIDEVRGQFHVHDLFDHAPEYVRKRMERRSSLKNKELHGETADNVRQTAPNGSSTQPNPTQPKKELAAQASPIGGGHGAVAGNDHVTSSAVEPKKTNADDRHWGDESLPRCDESFAGPRVSAEDIYQAYPRHVERAAALKAIANAIAAVRARPGMKAPESWLLERTKAYAAARVRAVAKDPAERAYTPYPQKWFTRGRYDDVPEEWGGETKSKFKDKTERYCPG